MHISASSLIALLASCTLVSATFNHGQKFSWGCDKDTKDKAPQPVRNDCSGKGSFFTNKGGKAVCCSDKTRDPPPKSDDCPRNWSWSHKASCCIPPKEVCERDCGEGYTFNKNEMRCVKNKPDKCGKGTWWHERNKECCKDNPGPDKGDCPKDRHCPKEWHWSKSAKRCKPDKPRSPEPDCDDWDDHNGCCGGHQPPKPSPKPPTPPPPPPPPPHPNPGYPTNPPHPPKPPTNRPKAPTNPPKPPTNPPKPPGYPANPPPGHGGHYKRNVDLRRSAQILFPKSETDMEYCPGVTHACTINTEFGGEWAYECIDPATELESCGGCASTGEGQDCTKIQHAQSVGCDLGVCAVYTCEGGFKPNGSVCALA